MWDWIKRGVTSLFGGGSSQPQQSTAPSFSVSSGQPSQSSVNFQYEKAGPYKSYPSASQVLTGNTSFGQTSGGGAVTGDAPGEVFQQGAPEGPGYDTAELDRTLSELDAFEVQTNELLDPEGVGDEFQESAYGRISTEETKAQEGLEARRQREERRGEAATTEQRRGTSELLKGLAARFGSGISTGLGAQAMVGKEGLRNIAMIRSAISEKMAEFERIGAEFTNEFNQQRSEVEATVATMKQQAKVTLQQALADINAQRGALRSRKADLINNAIQNYRSILADVNARNAEHQQRIDLMERDTFEKIRLGAAKLSGIANKIEPFSVQPGEIVFRDLSDFGDQNAINQLAGTDLGGGTTFNTAGQYGVITRDPEISDYQRFLQSQGITGGGQ